MEPLVRVVDDDDRRGPLGRERPVFFADDPMLEANTGAAEPGQSDAHVDPITVRDRPPIIARGRREDRPEPFLRLPKEQEPPGWNHRLS